MKEKYLIISPHSDDALFCCSNLILSSKYEVQILTVENDPKRIKEDENLYNFLNIEFHHLNFDMIDDSYYVFYQNYKQISDLDSENFLQRYYNSKLELLGTKLLNFIEKFSNKYPDYDIVSPLGVGHPFHHWVFGLLRCIGVEYCYRDFPHSYKRKAKIQFNERMKEYKLFSSFDITQFNEIKWKLASKFYRSQSGLLFYEQGYIKKCLPEEIYVPIIDTNKELPF